MNEVKWTGGTEHWTRKGDIRLFLWHKKASPQVPHAGTVFFVHGSSMASQPTFDLQASVWLALLAPAGTPHEVVAQLNAEVGKLVDLPDVRRALLGAGVEPAPSTPEAMWHAGARWSRKPASSWNDAAAPLQSAFAASGQCRLGAGRSRDSGPLISRR